MSSHISQWGNSLGVRLPKLIGEALGLKKGTEVSIYAQKGKIIIEKCHKYSLNELLKSSKKSCHGEIDTGENIGNEEW